MSGDSSAASTTSNEASSSYRSRGPAVTQCARADRDLSGQRAAARIGAPSSPLAWCPRHARPRTAQNRTSARRVLAEAQQGSAAAGSRRRNSAHVARQRTSLSFAADQLTMGARSPGPVNRPKDEQRLADDGRRCGGRRVGEILRQRGPGLGRADLAERARGFARDGRGRPRRREQLAEPGHGVVVLQLSGRERHRAGDLDVLVAARGHEQRAGLRRDGVLRVRRARPRISDAADRERGAPPHFGMRRLQEPGERLLIERAACPRASRAS